MKRILKALICAAAAFIMPLAAHAAQPAEAYIDNGRLVIEYQGNMSETAVAAYYNGSELCGAYVSSADGSVYIFGIPDKYTKIRVWFTDTDEMRTVHIIDRTAFTPAPTIVPTSEPTVQPTSEPEVENEYFDGYIGTYEDENEGTETFESCVFSVDCINALSSDRLEDDLRAILPSDGVIVPETDYEVTEETTVYDLLVEAAEICGFTVDGSPDYVSGIDGLSEFSCGPLSGWMYTVNGEVILAPINLYAVKPGDVVRVAYTCSLGQDL